MGPSEPGQIPAPGDFKDYPTDRFREPSGTVSGQLISLGLLLLQRHGQLTREPVPEGRGVESVFRSPSLHPNLGQL